MTTLMLVGIGLLALLGVLSLICTALLLCVIWVGRGEPDVNGDPERDADPTWPGWDAERRCSMCGHALTECDIEDARLLSNGATYFLMCGKCRVEAEAEIIAAAHARRATTMEVK